MKNNIQVEFSDSKIIEFNLDEIKVLQEYQPPKKQRGEEEKQEVEDNGEIN